MSAVAAPTVYMYSGYRCVLDPGRQRPERWHAQRGVTLFVASSKTALHNLVDAHLEREADIRAGAIRRPTA